MLYPISIQQYDVERINTGNISQLKKNYASVWWNKDSL